jgi:hypothetical protein
MKHRIDAAKPCPRPTCRRSMRYRNTSQSQCSQSRLPPHLDRVFSGIVNKRYRHFVLHYAVDGDRSTFDSRRVPQYRDMVHGFSISIVDFEFSPIGGDTGVEVQATAFELQSQQ